MREFERTQRLGSFPVHAVPGSRSAPSLEPCPSRSCLRPASPAPTAPAPSSSRAAGIVSVGRRLRLVAGRRRLRRERVPVRLPPARHNVGRVAVHVEPRQRVVETPDDGAGCVRRAAKASGATRRGARSTTCRSRSTSRRATGSMPKLTRSACGSRARPVPTAAASMPSGCSSEPMSRVFVRSAGADGNFEPVPVEPCERVPHGVRRRFQLGRHELEQPQAAECAEGRLGAARTQDLVVLLQEARRRRRGDERHGARRWPPTRADRGRSRDARP